MFFAGCTVVGPRLSPGEVTTIADATARQIMKIDFAHYHRDAPDYVHSDQSWLVGYRRKNRPIGSDDYFAVHIYDHTRKAEVIVSEPASR
jgi:hypothetical protein